MSDDASNTPEYSVSELAGALKRTVEDAYGFVRVRGELGRVTIAKSGHAYLDLKDDRAVIDGVMWKGNVGRLSFRPEEGLEVIVEGKLSTYPGRSKYQIIIDKMEPAGAGALMALLEARKKALAAEGLFDPGRKQDIPWLPEVIGVVTSPTGAVIRDILHRISDRFPRHVLLWPVLVQGDKAAQQITEAIEGFNALPERGTIPRPDLIIVARGGGSIEDLWAFNEENVVRAAAASAIPLISAVGHETDTTLIDFASDRRAPTPTGAAEIAVPVRAELMAGLNEQADRLTRSLMRLIDRRRSDFRSTVRALPRPEGLLGPLRQRLDHAGERLKPSLDILLRRRRDRLLAVLGGLRPVALKRDLHEKTRRLSVAGERLTVSGRRRTAMQRRELDALSARLAALGHESVLRRGYALVRDTDGVLVRAAASVSPGDRVEIEWSDGRKAARLEGGDAAPKPRAKRKTKSPGNDKQGQLL